MKDNSKKASAMEKASITGPSLKSTMMESSTMDRCMALARRYGKTALSMKESGTTTKDMGLASFNLQTE